MLVHATLATPTYTLTASDALIDDAEIERLWADGATSNVFNHPAWLRAAVKTIGSGRKLHVLAVRDDGVLVAYWPFWEKRLGAKETFIRIFEPVAARVSDYVMPLVRRDHSVDLLTEKLLSAIVGVLDAHSLLLWPKARPDRFSLPKCLTALSRSHWVHTVDHPCVYLTLTSNVAEFEHGWPARLRGEVRRNIRRIEEKGPVALDVASRREELRAALPGFFAMHSSNWRNRAGDAEFDDERRRRFFERVASKLPMSLLNYAELRVGSATVASHFGFCHDGALLFYKPTFAIEWSGYSPGRLLTAYMARWSVANRLNRLDFMQGLEPYKLALSKQTALTVSIALARRSAYPGWAWNTKVRRLAAEYRC